MGSLWRKPPSATQARRSRKDALWLKPRFGVATTCQRHFHFRQDKSGASPGWLKCYQAEIRRVRDRFGERETRWARSTLSRALIAAEQKPAWFGTFTRS
jgi:hypothetical protein